MRATVLAVDVGTSAVKVAATYRGGHRTICFPARIAMGLREGPLFGVVVRDRDGDPMRLGDLSDYPGFRLADAPVGMGEIDRLACFVAAAAAQLGVTGCRTLAIARDDALSESETRDLVSALEGLSVDPGGNPAVAVDRVMTVDWIGAQTADLFLSIKGDDDDGLVAAPERFALCDLGSSFWRVAVLSRVSGAWRYEIEDAAFRVDGAIEEKFCALIAQRYDEPLSDVQERMAQGTVITRGQKRSALTEVVEARAHGAAQAGDALAEFLANRNVNAIYVSGGHAASVSHIVADDLALRSNVVGEPLCSTARGALKSARRFGEDNG